MADAKITDFGDIRTSEVSLDPVVLYDDARISNGGDVPLSESMLGFEYLEIYSAFTSAGTDFGLETAQVTPEKLQDTSFGDVLFSQRYGDTASRVDVKGSPANTTNTSIRISAGTSTNWTNPGVYKVIGYKRRISKTGLEDLLSVLARPNLLLNTWLASPLVRNAREFDGNWAALAIGDYGHDMWFKYSTTHMAQIVEAGTYAPSTRHMLQANGTVIGEFLTPADGNHFLIAVPFAWDMFDLRASTIVVPWQPETLDRLAVCKRYYEAESNIVATLKEYGTGAFEDVTVSMYEKRVAPEYTAVIVNSSILDATVTTKSLRFRANASATTVYIQEWTADATIPLGDVVNDAAHRLEWS